MNDIKQLIRDHLSQVELMQLATQKDGQPWCCTVHFAADDELNIYWASLSSQRHSKEIGAQAKVGATMVISPHFPLIGVQIEGIAKRIDNTEEMKEALQVYGTQRDDEWRQKVLSGEGDTLYCIQPSHIQLFDLKNFPNAPKQDWYKEG